MPVLTWTCAHGDSPSVTIPLAATTAISPDDDSVDSNNVIVTGTGTISWFGPCSYPITKQVIFGAGVTLTHGPQMVLLTGGADRVTPGPSVGTYQTLGNGVWTEVIFSTLDTVDPLVGSVNALESQVATLQSQVATLQSQVANLQTQITNNYNSLQTEITNNYNTQANILSNHNAWITYIYQNLGTTVGQPPPGPL